MRDRRSATAIVRTLVVASATLAGLLVCFSIYQYWQMSPAATERAVPPATASRLNGALDPAQAARGTEGSNLAVGQAAVGPGQKIQMTLYPREGNRAQFEITADDWTPVAGSSSEFLLRAPEVRMCTNDGHPMRVTAGSGWLETERKAGGGLAIRHGKLTGGVEIDYDRLTITERARLPKELGGRADPDEIVHLELEELDFDLEWSKLVIPGRLHLSASDVELRAGDLEIRFNEAEDRVEHMRINQGGRLELRNRGTQLGGLSIPAVDDTGERRLTLVEWLAASIQAKLETQAQTAGQPERPAGTPTVTITEEGVPIIRRDSEEQGRRLRPPIRYYARFEGRINALQRSGETAGARLEADTLELIREVADKERSPVRPTARRDAVESDTVQAPAEETITLEWSDRMVVEACAPDDERCSGILRSSIIAHGSPVRVSNPDGTAAGTRLTYDPDAGEVRLEGMKDEPAVLRYGDEGTISGVSVYSRRDGDAVHLRVTGPGRVVRETAAVASPLETSEIGREKPSTIDFADQMEAHGQLITQTSIDFTGSIRQRRQRVLDRASFTGRVSIRQGDGLLEADSVELDLGAGSTPLHREHQTIERIAGRGHVLMSQGQERLTCQNLDITLTPDPEGRTVPRTLIATGEVAAEQGPREITARDKLVVDFDVVPRRSAAPDAARPAVSEAHPGAADKTALRRDDQQSSRTKVSVRRVRGWNDVTVNDPQQELEVSAGELDCTVADGRQIEAALVKGSEQSPASVRVDTFTVTGAEIKLHVPDQWAEVPGRGRLTFRSRKDLDGRRVAEPIPIAVTWSDWMKYQGRENRSVFMGNVHATSQTTTTFDCDQLFVEFEDVPADATNGEAKRNWWDLRDTMDRFSRDSKRDETLLPGGVRFAKEPTYILATGKAVAVTSDLDADTGDLKSRARISGPKLSVNLRPEVSKMLIEGPGNLLIEDNRPEGTDPQPAGTPEAGLFGVDESAAPSNTLIQWKELMWYDFSIDQTRFEGDVDLKYFSGTELARVRGQTVGSGSEIVAGRSTFLRCQVLTVDFHDRKAPAGNRQDYRMGRLSADRLRQFQASGSVRLQDQAEGFSLTADRVVYERDRRILVIHGTPQSKAHLVKQERGRLPNQVSAERFFYNLTTGRVEISGPAVDAR